MSEPMPPASTEPAEPVLLDALKRVARALGSTGHRFAFIGGMAVSAWARPRTTVDIEVKSTTSFKEEHLPDCALPAEVLTASGLTVQAVERRALVVEEGGMGLAQDLSALEHPIAFLDFEIVSPAIPCWEGCGPYARMPVQFSCHVEKRSGGGEA